MLRRLLQLYIGLVLYGVSTALFVHANLGAESVGCFSISGWLNSWGSVSVR
ncbi:membrane protein [Klebsiella pneumoniae]|nr:membrane protein [Klebsiella pneumoniae]